MAVIIVMVVSTLIVARAARRSVAVGEAKCYSFVAFMSTSVSPRREHGGCHVAGSRQPSRLSSTKRGLDRRAVVGRPGSIPRRGGASRSRPGRVFFDNPDYINVRVSPDGKTLAWIAPVDHVNNLFVAPIADPAAARAVTRVTGREPSSVFLPWAHTNRHLIFFRDHEGDENFRAYSVDIETHAVVPLTPDGGVKSFIQETDRKFPDEVLIRHNQRDKRYFDLFRVNIVNGTSELIFENPDFLA